MGPIVGVAQSPLSERNEIPPTTTPNGRSLAQSPTEKKMRWVNGTIQVSIYFFAALVQVFSLPVHIPMVIL